MSRQKFPAGPASRTTGAHVTRALIRELALVVALGVGLNACDRRDPVKPTNHDPVMHSLSASPDTLRYGDSTIVTCIATDQDGDTLVYDWACDWKMRIVGQPLPYPIKNNTLNSAETLYLIANPTQIDSAWATCEVRDRRGGGAIRALVFRLRP